ncbi:fatty acid hydroxylase superfamily-domain-containing protein [Hysterangium stoloniferum]|nr:fatty acid hydroxylase superfamily-domain-containing protein [Hysterangium stoloniferum]
MNFTVEQLVNPTNWCSIGYPWYHAQRPTFIPGVSDSITTLISPVVLYWIVSLAFHLLDISGWEWLEHYRVQPSAEILKKNLATKGEVVATVMKMQIMQTLFGYLWGYFLSGNNDQLNYTAELQETSVRVTHWLLKFFDADRVARMMAEHGTQLTYYTYWWFIPLIQLAFGMFVLDTYQYFVHRALHDVPFLYKHLHSVHHRLYVPYAYGSQYNHPFEGAIVDGLSATLASSFAGMSERQTLVLYAIATYKGIEDHCGYQFPWHPLRFLTSNDSEFHEIHHQVAGLKSNFSQPLFTFWDRALGTYMTMEQLEAKKGHKKIKDL